MWKSLGLGLYVFGIIVCLMSNVQVPTAQEKNIIIRVMDGRNGKPMANMHLMVSLGSSQEDVRELKSHVDLQTDLNGVALLSIDESTISRIQVWVDWHTLCQETPNTKSFSIEEIRKSGLSTPNNCGSVTREKAPNHLTVFARPAHFWEKLHR